MRTLSGHTRPYAVLGHPIGHTLSPAMHNAAFAALGMDAIYLAFDVSPARLNAVLNALRDMGFVGVNITVPHKEAALRHLARLDESARLLGAVNTIHFAGEGAIGFNTDGEGFLQAIREAFTLSVEGRHIAVIGTGGAGRAVALACAREGAALLSLADVAVPRAEKVAEEVSRARPSVNVRVLAEAQDWTGAAREADLVVHATPIGMKAGERSVLDAGAFRTGQCVFDLIYHTPETVLMKTAREAGARVSNGLGMLLHQGARAFEIWTGQSAPVAAMRAALEQAVYGT